MSHVLLQASVGWILVFTVALPAWLLRHKPAESEQWPEGWHYHDGLDPDDQY